MQSLRSFIEAMNEFPEEFIEVNKAVSSSRELTAAVYYLLSKNENKAVMFNKVHDSDVPVVTNVFGTRKRLAIALGTAEKTLHEVYRDNEKKRIEPEIVDSAPIQEIEFDRKNLDLRKLPVIAHNLEDNGPYITAGMMTVKDPDTGVRNSGIYRLMIKDGHRTGIHLSETSHAYYIYRKYVERKENMPVAVTIGTHPAVLLGSLSSLGIDDDEFSVMGGLLGEPLRITHCRSVDLEVPADGEICLEGSIAWNLSEPEGPIGEFHSMYSGVRNYPVLEVHHVTMRRNPIYLDICSGSLEHQLMGGLPRIGQIYNAVKKACPGVQDVYLPPSGFCRFACYVSIKKMVEGEPSNAAAAVFGADAFIRNVVVVDDNVDIFNDSEVLKAVNLYMNPKCNFVIPFAKGSQIDPAADEGIVSKIGIDATRPLNAENVPISISDSISRFNPERLFES